MRLLELYEDIKRGPGEVNPDPQSNAGEESNAQPPENGTRGTQKATYRLWPRQGELLEPLGTELCAEVDLLPLLDAHEVQELMWAVADAVRADEPIPEACYALGEDTVARLLFRPEAADSPKAPPDDEYVANARISNGELDELYRAHQLGTTLTELTAPWKKWGYSSPESARRSIWSRFRALEKHPWRHRTLPRKKAA